MLVRTDADFSNPDSFSFSVRALGRRFLAHFSRFSPHLSGFPLQFGGKLRDAAMVLLQIGDEFLALAQGKPDAFDLQIRDHVCAARLPAHPEIDVRFGGLLTVTTALTITSPGPRS